jgi:hypothetical protein
MLDAVADILESKGFQRSGDNGIDLQNAYYMAKERMQQEGIAATKEKAKKSIVGTAPKNIAPSVPGNARQAVTDALANMGI